MINSIVEWFVKKGYITENEYDIYYYGLFVLVVNLCSDFSVLMISLLTGNLFFGFTYLIFFSLLRISFGGYHAKNPISCFFIFNFLFLINLYIFNNVAFSTNVKAFNLLLVIIVFFTSVLKTRNDKVYVSNEFKKRILCVIYGLLGMATQFSRVIFLSLITNLFLHYVERIRIYHNKSSNIT